MAGGGHRDVLGPALPIQPQSVCLCSHPVSLNTLRSPLFQFPPLLLTPASSRLLSALSLDAKHQAFLLIDPGLTVGSVSFGLFLTDTCWSSACSHFVNHHGHARVQTHALHVFLSLTHTLIRKMIFITPRGIFRCQDSFWEHTCVAGLEQSAFPCLRAPKLFRGGGGGGRRRGAKVSQAPAMCSGAISFLPPKVKLLKHLLKESQPHLTPAASAAFSNKTWWEKEDPVSGRQVSGENGWSGLTGAIRNYFLGLGQNRKGLKVVNPPHEE